MWERENNLPGIRSWDDNTILHIRGKQKNNAADQASDTIAWSGCKGFETTNK